MIDCVCVLLSFFSCLSTHLIRPLPLLPPAGERGRLLERRRQRGSHSSSSGDSSPPPRPSAAAPLAPQRVQREEDEEPAAEQAAEGEVGLVERWGALRPGADGALRQHEEAHRRGRRPLLPLVVRAWRREHVDRSVDRCVCLLLLLLRLLLAKIGLFRASVVVVAATSVLLTAAAQTGSWPPRVSLQ
jgi:hypothetical protein